MRSSGPWSRRACCCCRSGRPRSSPASPTRGASSTCRPSSFERRHFRWRAGDSAQRVRDQRHAPGRPAFRFAGRSRRSLQLCRRVRDHHGGGAPQTSNSESGHGFGDVSVGLAKTLLQEGAGWWPDLIGRVTWDADTGQDPGQWRLSGRRLQRAERLAQRGQAAGSARLCRQRVLREDLRARRHRAGRRAGFLARHRPRRQPGNLAELFLQSDVRRRLEVRRRHDQRLGPGDRHPEPWRRNDPGAQRAAQHYG